MKVLLGSVFTSQRSTQIETRRALRLTKIWGIWTFCLYVREMVTAFLSILWPLSEERERSNVAKANNNGGRESFFDILESFARKAALCFV